MKKLVSKKLLYTGVFLMVFSLSCTDLTEELPSDITTLQSEEEFVSALGEAYTILGQFQNHGSLFSLQEVASDEAAIPVKGQDWLDGFVWVDAHSHTILPDHGPTNTAWNFLFSGVNTTSRLILQFETLVENGSVDPDLAASYIAEMKVLRAFYYYWLLDSFGNVPIIENFDEIPANPSNNSDFQAGRNEVFNFVESQILDNIDIISDDPSASYGRMHKYAAHFLLAKLYLNAEVYTGTAQWAKADEQLDILINSNLFSLEQNYDAIFATENSGSSETIFAIPYDEVFLPGFNMHHMTLHYEQQKQFDFQEQPWNGYTTLAEFYRSFEDGDVRKDRFFVGQQYAMDGTPLVDDAGGGLNVDLTVEVPAVLMSDPSEYPTYRTAGARFGKFEYATGSTSNLNNDYPIFRYSDVILMKAETQLQMNGGGQMYLDMIRDRAEVDLIPNTMENLLAERGREMYTEGWRRQDLIRFDAYDAPWWEKEQSEAFRHVFPIPQDQIDANPNLTQSPGWDAL